MTHSSQDPPTSDPAANSAAAGGFRQTTFIEEIYAVLSEAAGKLVATTPEVQGVAVAIVYDPSLENTDPHGLILGNFNTPGSLAAAGVQVAKLQITIANKLQEQAHAAQAAFAELQQETHVLEKEGAGKAAGDPAGTD